MSSPTSCRCPRPPRAGVLVHLVPVSSSTSCRCPRPPRAGVLAHLVPVSSPTSCRCPRPPRAGPHRTHVVHATQPDAWREQPQPTQCRPSPIPAASGPPTTSHDRSVPALFGWLIGPHLPSTGQPIG